MNLHNLNKDMLIKLLCEIQEMNELRNMRPEQLINLNQEITKELHKRKLLDDEWIVNDIIHKYSFNVSDSFFRFILYLILLLHMLYKKYQSFK